MRTESVIPTDIKILKEIEKTKDVFSIFQYKDTTAWLAMKELITVYHYDKHIRLATGTQKEILSWKGLRTIGSALFHYIAHLTSREKKNLFLGASTGLFEHKGEILDAYFPYYDMEVSASIYMFNCGNLSALNKYTTYVKEHHIVIENYLLVPVKKIVAKILLYTLSKKKKKDIATFNVYLKKQHIDLSDKVLYQQYVDFVAGYILYRLFFKALAIKQAYIVSASTKSDMVAALKSLGIKVIEIQHGIVGELHRGYNFHMSPSIHLPVVDRIDVYNQFWKDEIVKAGYFKPDTIYIVGRLKYDIVSEDISDLQFTYIIFTGQGAFFEQIIAFFIQADTYLHKKNIKMFYKPHPRELKSEIVHFKEAIKTLNACFFYEGEYTTEALIKNAYAHISIFSSCHFDAVYFKNKTYIFDVMDENMMHYYASTSPNNFIKIKYIQEVLEHAHS